MNVVVANENQTKIMVLPVVPDRLGGIEYFTNNETFESLQGKITLIGNEELKSFKIESIFPVFKTYPFIKLNSNFNGWEYHKFFMENVNKPVRLVVTTDLLKTLINTLCTYKYILKTVKANGNIVYSLEFTEFNNAGQQNENNQEQL